MTNENVFQYLERHREIDHPYWLIGTFVDDPSISRACDNFSQAFLLANGEIVDARGQRRHGAIVRTFHALYRLPGSEFWDPEGAVDLKDISRE